MIRFVLKTARLSRLAASQSAIASDLYVFVYLRGVMCLFVQCKAAIPPLEAGMLKDEPAVTPDELAGKAAIWADAVHSTGRFDSGQHKSLNNMTSSVAREARQALRGILYCQVAEDEIAERLKAMAKKPGPSDIKYLGCTKVDRATVSVDYNAIKPTDVSADMFFYIKSEVEKVSGQ